jgi:hypothetical protein
MASTVFVKLRNSLREGGISASIGSYAFGFTWGAWAAITVATALLFLGCGAGRKDNDQVRTRTAKTAGGNLSFFRRQRSGRSARGSLVDNESQRRVKDEYP